MAQGPDSDPAGGGGRANVPTGTYRAQGDVSGGRLAGIAVLESGPENIKLHRIEDHELELMMNISRPIALAVSSATLGACLGLLPSVFAIVATVLKPASISLFDMVTVAICAVCFALFVTTGIAAIQGHRQANRLLAAIRSRPLSPL